MRSLAAMAWDLASLPPPAATARRVLVVDDSRAMRQIIIRTLRQAGWRNFQADQAHDGAQALAMATERRPDLVLADWHMPKRDGLELLRGLRMHGLEMPFCFVTSETSPRMRESALAAGALGLITKPFSPEVFREVLADLLQPA